MITSIISCSLGGGLGNQLFELANAYALSRHLDISLCILENQFVGAGTGNHPNKYYNTLFHKIPRCTIDKPLITYRERTWWHMPITDAVKSLIRPNTILKLDGFYQSDQYFLGYSQDIKQLFTPEGGIKEWLKMNSDVVQKWPELFEDHEFCFIGVRRGDYVEKAYFHNPCGMDYFQKAMLTQHAAKYYIASDDLAWCKSKFVGDQFVFFDIADDLVQLLIGCLFKKYIIANSTFHWWMSFLSVYEVPSIVAPDKWIFGPNAPFQSYSSIYRKEMQIIQRLVEV